MATKVISVSIPVALLQKLDQAAEEDFATRSEFIRDAVVERLRYIDRCRARLAATALNTDIPTEEELLKLLNWRRARRTLNNYMGNNKWRSAVSRS